MTLRAVPDPPERDGLSENECVDLCMERYTAAGGDREGVRAVYRYLRGVAHAYADLVLEESK